VQKNVPAFLRYSNFCVGTFYFASPCSPGGQAMASRPNFTDLVLKVQASALALGCFDKIPK